MIAMRGIRPLALLAALTVALAAPPSALAGPKKKPLRVVGVAANHAFCPSRALVAGNVVIQPGRCYNFLVTRNSAGTFLAFAPAGPAFISPGHVIRLRTPVGARVRGRILYLVPIRPAVAIVPLDTIAPVAVRVEDFGPSLAMTLVSTPSPGQVVVFSVRL